MSMAMVMAMIVGVLVILGGRESMGQVYPGSNPYIGPALLSKSSGVIEYVGSYGYQQLAWGNSTADTIACPLVESIGMFNVSCTVPAFLVQGFIWANSSDPVQSALGYSLLDSVFAFLNSGSSVAPGNDVWGFDDPQFGNAYAIVGVANGISIVDVTIPQSPREVGYFFGSYSIWRDIKTRGSYAYYVQDSYQRSFAKFTAVNQSYYDLLTPSDGLSIIDLSRADSPRLVRHDKSIFTYAHNLFIEVDPDRPYAYVCGGDVTAVGGIAVISLQDPENPVLLHSWNIAYIHDVMVQKRGDRYLLYGAAIYAKANDEEGLYIIDVTDPVNPVILKSAPAKFPLLHNVWPTANSQYLYCTHESNGAPISIWDATDIDNLHEVGALYLTENNADIAAHNAFVRDNRLFIAYYSMGTVVYDVSKPTQPALIGTFDTYPQSWVNNGGLRGNWGVYPFAAARPELDEYYVYSNDITNGLFVTIVRPYPQGPQGPAGQDCPSYTWLIVVTFIFEAILLLIAIYLIWKRWN